jgi:hypothetical protein
MIFSKNLKKVDFIFEITNSINRSYSFDIIFLNEAFEPVYTIAFIIPAANAVLLLRQRRRFLKAHT